MMKSLKSGGRILITYDKDFGELVFRLRRPSRGVILLRTSTTDPARRFQLLEKILKLIDVEGKFVVVRDECREIKRNKALRTRINEQAVPPYRLPVG